MNLRVSVVDYLNSRPFVVGLDGFSAEHISVTKDHPAECARKLINHEVDLGLVPVAILQDLETPYIMPEWGIGCSGPVGSVCLVSEVPVDEIVTVALDPESRTSNQLCKLLLEGFWNSSAVMTSMQAEITGSHAALLIGDKALRRRENYTYIYDLGRAWCEWTGLPFTFAVWAGQSRLSEDLEEVLHQAFTSGLMQLDTIIPEETLRFPKIDVDYYLRNQIDHRLGTRHMQGLQLFQQKSKEMTGRQKQILI